MTQHDRDLKADLIELACEETEDAMSAVAALVSAGFTLLSTAVGPAVAARALHGTVADAISKGMH